MVVMGCQGNWPFVESCSDSTEEYTCADDGDDEKAKLKKNNTRHCHFKLVLIIVEGVWDSEQISAVDS